MMNDTFRPKPTITFRGRPACSANATGRIASDWGMVAVPCVATRGLRSFLDRQGITRHYCPARGHEADVVRRFGRQSDEDRRTAEAIQRISADFERQARYADAREDALVNGRIILARQDEPEDQHGETCPYSGHVPGCSGAAGGEHELLPGWFTMEIDGLAVDIETI